MTRRGGIRWTGWTGCTNGTGETTGRAGGGAPGSRLGTGLLALAILAGAVGLATAADTPPVPLLLVTPEEAALPDLQPVGAAKDLNEGPVIILESPEPDAIYEESFPVEVLFQVGPSGQPVNPESLRVVYKKAWGIDITERLAEYIAPDGIRVPAADFPSGRHTVQIYIEDVDANASSRRVTVTVRK